MCTLFYIYAQPRERGEEERLLAPAGGAIWGSSLSRSGIYVYIFDLTLTDSIPGPTGGGNPFRLVVFCVGEGLSLSRTLFVVYILPRKAC